MASVQELLAAAQAQKSPLQSLLEGAARGFGQGYQEAPGRAKAMLDLDIERQTQQRQQEMSDLLQKRLAGQAEDQTQQAFGGVGGDRKSPLPGLRLEQIKVGPKGYLTPEFKEIEKKPSAYQTKEYLDEGTGKVRIGSYDPDTMKFTRSPDDPVAPTNLRVGEQNDQFTQKRLTSLGDALDPSKQKGAFAVSKSILDRAERLETLGNALPNLRSAEVEELAIGLNAMLSGSNTGSQEQVKALVPKTALGDARKFQEWFTGNPTGTDQQEFVKRMLGSVAREKATAAAQIERTQMQRVQRYADLERSVPDDFYNVLQAQGIDPDKFKSWRKGGFKAISAVQSPEGAAPAASGPKPGAIEDGHRFKGGDPSVAANWEKI